MTSQSHGREKHYLQLCWVVPDLEAAIGNWVRTTGAGPFFVFGQVHFTESHYRGTPMDIAPARAAMGYCAETQIELIQPIENTPSIWTEFIPFGRAGFHHVGLYCNNFDEDRKVYIDNGSQVAFEGLMMEAKTCYLDTVERLGFITELIQVNSFADDVFRKIRSASVAWDGRDPIRPMG